ncbi:phage portal protein [Pseudochelatococcus contaminans]|uniref:HK97 family phage portal protein n=1 Tax=Pseudochelatococcus contaminans TaxID=1538103 RepID=A0A7W5Z4H9_9HYPH|nr:phage portal protein [Pseudochelatococcus contaminans]MBB3809567.1 HK97 family phage portal protein [Pseudochelatococcus contaminans]
MASFINRLFGGGGRTRAPDRPAEGAEPPATERKASRAAMFAVSGLGRPVWTPRDYTALAREGFQRNAIVHRCVRLIAESAASVPLMLRDGRREYDDHPLLALLTRPNPRETGAALMEAVYGHLLIAGNAYVEAVLLDGAPRELYALRPDRMQVAPGPDGWPAAYDYRAGTQTVRFHQSGDVPPILHLRLFHPADDHYGLSPMEAAAVALDIHNASASWNKALLDNAARPSGALVYAGPDGANLTDAQFERLKQELEAQFQGVANAGRPLLLEGGLDWRQLSLTPAEMDFMEARAAAVREIALAFGVPPLMLGLPGDSTYANYAEANRAFWRQTVIPLVRRTAQALAHWLTPGFANAGARGGLTLEPDLDGIEALAGEREALWRRVSAADFLTDDEKREAVGYGRRTAGGPRERH